MRTEGVRRRILADLAHEPRTPIATVEAYLEGMADGVLPADESTFAVLRDQTARMRRLAEDVDTVSRAEEHRLDLHRVMLEPAADNALRHTPVGGQVRIASDVGALVAVKVLLLKPLRLPDAAAADSGPDAAGAGRGGGVGADDYLTKPFSPRELVARIRVMPRRPRTGRLSDPGAPAPPIRRVGDLEILPLAREVRRSGDLVTLTPIKFDLLDALSGSPNVAFSRRQLIEHVWGANYFGDEHLVDVHIGNLRRKLGDDAGAPRYVRTVRSIGYRIGSGQPEN